MAATELIRLPFCAQAGRVPTSSALESSVLFDHARRSLNDHVLPLIRFSDPSGDVRPSLPNRSTDPPSDGWKGISNAEGSSVRGNSLSEPWN